MIIYKYVPNLFEYDPESELFCKKHNIVYFKPTPQLKRWLSNWLKVTKLPTIECKPDVVCYWRSFGTWGMYHPDDFSISVCPYKIENAPGGLKGVIKHEIAHLLHPEANGMSHVEKEKYIESVS